MRTAPKLERLMAELRMTEAEAKQARWAMHRGRLGSVTASGFAGLEYVHDSNGDWLFCYLNSGDSYSPTLVRRRGANSYRISTLAEEVEALEERGVRVP
jgi:hypothetical protein